MSNVKQFHISGIVQFDFWSKPEAKDFLAFAAIPNNGIELQFNDAGYRKNSRNNGECAVYRFIANGVSGNRLSTFGRLVMEILESEHGYIDELTVYDLQNDCNLYNGSGQSKISYEAAKWVKMGYQNV